MNRNQAHRNTENTPSGKVHPAAITDPSIASEAKRKVEDVVIMEFPVKKCSVESRPRRDTKEMVEEAAPSTPRAVGPDHTPTVEAKTYEMSAEAYKREATVSATKRIWKLDKPIIMTVLGPTPLITIQPLLAFFKNQKPIRDLGQMKARCLDFRKKAKPRLNIGRFGALCSDEDTDSDSQAGSDVGSEDINSALPGEKKASVENRKLESMSQGDQSRDEASDKNWEVVENRKRKKAIENAGKTPQLDRSEQPVSPPGSKRAYYTKRAVLQGPIFP